MLNECADCTTEYAADLESCPHCGSTKQANENENEAPKATPTVRSTKGK